MWTKNGKKFILTQLFYRGISKTLTRADGIENSFTYSSNNIETVAILNSFGGIISQQTSSSTTNNTGLSVFCGSGDTQPTKNDITLAEPLALKYINGSISATDIVKTITYIVQNDNEAPVTIRELGLCLTVHPNGTSSLNGHYLLNRKILDTPIEVAVGEQAVITFTIDATNILDGDGWNTNMQLYTSEALGTTKASTIYKNVKGAYIERSYKEVVIGNVPNSSQYQSDILTASSVIAGAFSIYCGTGTTLFATTDYVLENPVQLACTVNPTMTFDEDNNCIIQFILSNSSGETYTISEICLTLNPVPCSTKLYRIMLNRKLLPTPVIMAPNDVYTFVYKINTSNITD